MMSKNNELIFNQPLLQMRVIKTEKGEYDIEIAMYDGPSISTIEPNEFIAKTLVQGFLEAYNEGLKELQERMLEAISNISDEQEGESSSKKSHIPDNEGEDS